MNRSHTEGSSRRRVLTGAFGFAVGAPALAGSAQAQVQATPKALFQVPPTLIPVVASEQSFPVRRIYCIGRNYAAHAREMGSGPTRELPFFFQKPTDAVQNVAIGMVADHPYPTLTKNYHYELELVAALNRVGATSRRNVPSSMSMVTQSAWT